MGIIVKVVLKRFWKEIVLFILLASVIGGVTWYLKDLHNQIKEWQDKYMECTNTTTSLTTRVASLTTSIDTQNQEIEKLRKIVKSKGKLVLKYKDDIEKMKQSQKKQIQEIINEPTPIDCNQSIDYLINGVKDLQWKE